jgi:PHD-finger
LTSTAQRLNFHLTFSDTQTFTGAGPDASSPLLVNDMIIEINGKRVGGMTMFSAVLELQIAGPRLTLLVSRYKFTNELQQQLSAEESSQTAAVDYFINEDRRLDWNDIGFVPCDSKVGRNEISDDILEENKEIACPMENDEYQYRSDDINTRYHERNTATSESDSKLASTDEPVNTSQAIDVAESENLNRLNIHENLIENRIDDAHVLASDICLENHVRSVEKVEQSKSDQIENPTEGSAEICCDDAEACYSPSNKELCPKKIFSYGNEGLFVELTELNSSSSESSVKDYEGNVILPCVCGNRHGKSVESFWIQCENCDSWFHTNSFCVGFTEIEASYIKMWICGGCQPADVLLGSTLSPRAKILSPVSKVTHSKQLYSNLCQVEFSVSTNLLQDASKSISDDDARDIQLRGMPRECKHFDFVNVHNKSQVTSESLMSSQQQSENFASTTTDDALYIQPKKKTKMTADGKWTRPRGFAPSGYEWDYSSGHWLQTERSRSNKPEHEKKLENTEDRNAMEKESHGIPENLTKRFGQKKLRTVEEKNDDGRAYEQMSKIFKVGDMVMIQKHSWPGVNNEEGMAKVLNAYVDDVGDQLYDVKYVIGGVKRRQVMAIFLSKIKLSFDFLGSDGTF